MGEASAARRLKSDHLTYFDVTVSNTKEVELEQLPAASNLSARRCHCTATSIHSRDQLGEPPVDGIGAEVVRNEVVKDLAVRAVIGDEEAARRRRRGEGQLDAT